MTDKVQGKGGMARGGAFGNFGKKTPVKGRPATAGPTLSVAEARAKVSPARMAAFEILTLVGQGKGHSDELLHSALTDALSPEDRNLTTALVMGVLRWQIALDARVRGLLQRPEQKLVDAVAITLRMGAFQLLHMDRIPAHAALSESVELCRAAGEPHATGMVNAVLRKVAAAQKPGVRIHESTAAFAERLGHPQWLVERWVAAYGRDAAVKICEADQQEHGEGGMFVEAEVVEGALPAAALPLMDDGSRLVAEIAAAAVPDGLDHTVRVWDCCAAPGGKTLMLALRLGEAEVLATDVSAKRLAQTEARLRRYAYAERVKCAVADAAAEKNVRGQFDLILCDVPCSGTGTLAGNPEIRHMLKVEELTRQSDRQRKILAGALGRLAEGGRLVYSTCSLEPEECERVVEAVVAAGGVRRVAVDGFLEGLVADGVLKGELGSAVRDGALRTLPGVHGCDGFFAVVLEKV
ncbi:MAG: Fmu (Sun) domain protein [Acidobacteriaceae bacterium]|nr:Fmu (Sun) domain protein [Acidobacteriaceae bacterium]